MHEHVPGTRVTRGEYWEGSMAIPASDLPDPTYFLTMLIGAGVSKKDLWRTGVIGADGRVQ